MVLLADDIVFLIECKVGADHFERSAIWQAEQYALDMRDFHAGSHDRVVVPVLVATGIVTGNRPLVRDGAPLYETKSVGGSDFPRLIYETWLGTHDRTASPIEPEEWEQAEYRPTPSIVQAACLLYEDHDAREINLAGASNLDGTVDAILELVRACRREHRRGIAFITGAPGSGKTLAGLQVVHDRELTAAGEAAGVFLSGNRPLVEVISRAIEDSTVRSSARSRRDAAREVRTFIQHAYAFRNEYARYPDRTPPEHIILFDEAQRAWDAKQVTSRTQGTSTASEPELFMDIMNRVPNWAVVIALVGGGQEINRGEAGLGEWGRAIANPSHVDWLVRASPAVLPGAPLPPGGLLFDGAPPPSVSVTSDSRLHLTMNVRSPRAERLNHWVDALLDLRLENARASLPDSREYPMVLTRSLESARAWLRDRQDEDQRTGLVASADARRLRAWGLETQTLQRERSWADWFLREPGDVRSSTQLEVPATNFDCQGLELDWAGVCWGNDFSYDGDRGDWKIRRFLGSRWTRANAERSRFILNGYRVLLTRARRGQVIWVPQPEVPDPTLKPEDFDTTAELLRAAGVPMLD
ncbi:MAG: DUF2075 domain-containing protein [Dehalococcoidia bacterium]|nr:DUF2075 domain-containing protein [Dehalococcoidia bacterium]